MEHKKERTIILLEQRHRPVQQQISQLRPACAVQPGIADRLKRGLIKAVIEAGDVPQRGQQTSPIANRYPHRYWGRLASSGPSIRLTPIRKTYGSMAGHLTSAGRTGQDFSNNFPGLFSIMAHRRPRRKDELCLLSKGKTEIFSMIFVSRGAFFPADF